MQFSTLVDRNLPQNSSQNGPDFEIEWKQMLELIIEMK